MRLLYSYLRRYWGWVYLALLLATISQMFLLIDPLILRYLVDKYAIRYSQYTREQFVYGVGFLLLAAVGATLVGRMAKSVQDYVVNIISVRLGSNLYSDGIRHSLELPYSVFEDQRSGETLAKLQRARTDVEKFVPCVISTLFSALFGLAFVTVYAFTLHWVLAVSFFVSMALTSVLSYRLSLRIRNLQKVITAKTVHLAGSTTESLRNIKIVKCLGLGRQEIERLNAETENIVGLELRKLRTLRLVTFVQVMCFVSLRAALTFVMVYFVYTGQITVGQWLSLSFYWAYIFGPLQDLGTAFNTFRETEASLDSFSAILLTPTETTPASPVLLGLLDSLAFEDVNFSYQTSPALSGVCFSVARGETIAFVGPSGSGKSTLVNLIVGVYSPQCGRVLYNRTSCTDIDLKDLRAQIGFVPQDTELFSGSIRYNLLFACPCATDDECVVVLKQAACDDLLRRGDRGLDTLIGEGGMKLSGGEKQRLSIARALLRRPRLLVFDEATSSLDSITEVEVTATIRALASRDVITILVAHRLSTVMHADRIYVLERGQIVDIGSHLDLLERKGLYYAMWRQQVDQRLDHHDVHGSAKLRIPALDC
ncbi:MAG TPA: ABC transporter ATP-binding protein [Candidatus Angelobacter sp.]|jgi:ATP-binding cassette subfamily B protein|nr:ABC transporter ATP-binding protein [Candidatus Angelobacter sp.]